MTSGPEPASPRNGPLDDPLRADQLEDPYPRYAALRRAGPAVRDPALGVVWVSRYADVLAVLHDPATFSSDIGDALRSGRVRLLSFEPSPAMDESLAELGGSPPLAADPLLSADPPAHTRVRKLVATAFTPRRVAAMASSITAIADELIDAIEDHGCAELSATLAVPLPVRVIAEQLGASGESVDELKAWSEAYVAPIGRRIAPDEQVAAMRATTAMHRWFATRVTAARAAGVRPDDGSLLATLANAELDGEAALDDDELVAVLQTLLVAGNVTTTSLILEAVRQRLSGALGTSEQLVEEALRYEAPAQVFYRIATADTTIGDCPIGAGEVLAILYGSANRDNDAFPDADTFCPAREQRPQHLAFGHGIHACLGAALARLEARIVLDQLDSRLPGLRLARDWRPRHGDSMSLRGLATLDVEWDAPPRARN